MPEPRQNHAGPAAPKLRPQATRRSLKPSYRVLFESMAQGVVYLDDKGRIISANPAAARILGVKVDELPGSTWLDPRFRPVHENGELFNAADLAWSSGLVRGKPLNGLVLGIHSGNENGYRWLRMDVIPHSRRAGGTSDSVCVIFDDITERRQAEEIIRVSEKLAATGRLAASIAHEINNPLESVTNLLYLLENDPHLDHQARQYAALAQQELGRVGDIARHTLGFYRDTSRRVAVNLRLLLDNVIELYDRKLRRKNIHLTREYGSEAEIDGFPGELRQVFSNLVINAIESVGVNGRIRVRVSAANDWTHGQRSGLRVTIADDGAGIPLENQGRIFAPFFTTKGESGTGLGLWVSRGIVLKHGGTIRFRGVTRPGRSGTVFSVFLPFRASRAQSAEASTAA